jgi:hypothetical protein
MLSSCILPEVYNAAHQVRSLLNESFIITELSALTKLKNVMPGVVFIGWDHISLKYAPYYTSLS